jgi:CRP-like cAMP-binding protein
LNVVCGPSHSQTIYFVLSGLISLTITTKNGSSIEAATVGREGAVGLYVGLGKRHSFTRATMQISGICACVGTSRFAQITNGNVAVQDLISRYSEVRLAEAQQLSACNAVHDAGSRLCRWLLQSADRIGSDQLPLTQELLAQMLGVRRTTITLLAQVLQNKGMIRYTRGHIVILNRSQLEACACECYHVMRHGELPRRLGVSF